MLELEYFVSRKSVELDDIESEYDFRVSTALGITAIALYYLLVKSPLNQTEIIGTALILVVGGLMFYGGYLVYSQRWHQMLIILNHLAVNYKKIDMVYDANAKKFKLV